MIRFIARTLRNVRAGEHKLAWYRAGIASAPSSILLSSSCFAAGGLIPRRHAGKNVGENISPALAWSGVLPEAAELVMIVEDPDAPLPRPFVHAIVIGISPTASSLAEGALSAPSGNPNFMLGRNSFGRSAYAGPRALPGHGPHRYAFQIFALRRRLTLTEPASRSRMLSALGDDVIARGRIDGIFERP
ncbi:YbhB/YbcL family Raf kinase inhibitor-like protein [Bradyrhizobium sp. Ai1a-2]|uniref:YbhB/YbcL family Raf kinase inhibitor-like protein n=1 Tax=Bradyrhizobium sp. Ai1a-2 TaxID=196490 RepID=UPI000A02DD7B|nr:YbhB/YbcL family Raf kinase inhibitor-like protein [Bradyrhizobium sp. Ai1a-2]